MPASLIEFIAKYGYLSIFLLVFIQEVGVPTFPNEIVLIYFGYLSAQHVLEFFGIFSLAIFADFSGSFIIYKLFNSFSGLFKKHKPKWFPVSLKKIQLLKKKISLNGTRTIFIGRLTPYLRGYISAVSGMLHVKTKKYVPIIIVSAIIWSGGYVSVGYILAPYWNKISTHLGVFSNVLIIIPAALIIWYLVKFFLNKKV